MKQKGEDKSRKKRSTPRTNLTPYGSWLYDVLEKYLDSNMETLTSRSGISQSGLSRLTRIDPTARTSTPKRETVLKIDETLRAMAEEQGLPWPDQVKEYLLHAATYATNEEIEEAEAERYAMVNDLIRLREQLL